VNALVWLTGLSGSGKSTIARSLESRLHAEQKLAYVLDGDAVRRGLNSDLGFSDADRAENIRRAGHVAAMLADAGVIVIAAFISPFRRDRDRVRELVGDERFLEVFLDAPIDVCEQRDPKGLYAKARAGEIASFTGISDPYEPPDAPAVEVRTDRESHDESAQKIIAALAARGLA